MDANTLQEPTELPGLSLLPHPDDMHIPLAPEATASNTTVQAAVAVGEKPQFEISGSYVSRPEQIPAFSPDAVDGCQQLFGNTKLDVNETAGTFLPWGILQQNIYLSNTVFHSAQHSIFM